MSLVADLLQACAAAPQPWQPGEFVRGRPEPIQDITFCLSTLCQANLLRMVLNEDNETAGFHLTPRGAELARDPQALARFVEAEGLDFSTQESLQARTIRQTFCEPLRPRVNRLLFGLNFLVFGIGLLLATQKGVGRDFLLPSQVIGGAVNRAFEEVLLQTGLLSATELLDGEWWRLLACGFVHIGLLHLGMNMYALRILGNDCEWLWGSWRYLILYLLSVLGGSCAAMVQPITNHQVVAVAGASGGLCGLLAAVAAWVLLNRRYLPRRLVQRQMRAMTINIVLITVISLIPNVSWQAHLGGAVVGLVAALLLHLHRFGSTLTKGLGLLGLVALPMGCVGGLHWLTQHDQTWQQLRTEYERRHEHKGRPEDRLRDQQRTLEKEVDTYYRTTLVPLLQKPCPRDADEKDQALKELQEFIGHCHQVAAESARFPGDGRKFDEFREASQEYFFRWEAFLTSVRTCLEQDQVWKPRRGEEELRLKAQKRWLKASEELTRGE